jgi:hypothetical protein
MALIWFKWLLGLMMYAHPFYISVTEINHNATDKTLEISCKIFGDDMEEVLKKSSNTAVDLSDPKKLEANNKLIEAYVRNHLSLMADGKTVKLNYVGFEKEKESVYCYFEGQNIPSVKKLDVINSLLHDLNSDQINIMHVTVGGERKSLKLDHPKKTATFTF